MLTVHLHRHIASLHKEAASRDQERAEIPSQVSIVQRKTAVQEERLLNHHNNLEHVLAEAKMMEKQIANINCECQEELRSMDTLRLIVFDAEQDLVSSISRCKVTRISRYQINNVKSRLEEGQDQVVPARRSRSPSAPSAGVPSGSQPRADHWTKVGRSCNAVGCVLR